MLLTVADGVLGDMIIKEQMQPWRNKSSGKIRSDVSGLVGRSEEEWCAAGSHLCLFDY